LARAISRRHDPIKAHEPDKRRSLRRIEGPIDSNIGCRRLVPIALNSCARIYPQIVEIAGKRQLRSSDRRPVIAGDIKRAVQLYPPNPVEQVYRWIESYRGELPDHGGDRGLLPFDIERERTARRVPAGFNASARRKTTTSKITDRQTVDPQPIGVNSDACARISRLDPRERGTPDIGCEVYFTRSLQCRSC
jgi:hypothetical protein